VTTRQRLGYHWIGPGPARRGVDPAYGGHLSQPPKLVCAMYKAGEPEIIEPLWDLAEAAYKVSQLLAVPRHEWGSRREQENYDMAHASHLFIISCCSVWADLAQ
jgi:hypothetical protein